MLRCASTEVVGPDASCDGRVGPCDADRNRRDDGERRSGGQGEQRTAPRPRRRSPRDGDRPAASTRASAPGGGAPRPRVGRVARSSSTISVDGHPSFTLSSSRFSARLSRVETAVGLMPSTRAVGVAVELEHDPQREHLALAGAQGRERRLELGREPLDEALLDALGQRGGLLAPAPSRLGAEPVERGRPRDPEQPGSRAAAPCGRTCSRGEAPSRTSSSRGPRRSRGRGSGRAGSRRRRRGAPRRPRRGSRAGALASGCSSVIACTPLLRRRGSSASHENCRH